MSNGFAYLPGDVLAAPESALCGSIGVELLIPSILEEEARATPLHPMQE